jgi:hypothetical protein
MEYGEAINGQALASALRSARSLLDRCPGLTVAQASREAVALAYCTCVTSGEDAAEQRYSDIHRHLVEEVAERLRSYSTRTA